MKRVSLLSSLLVMAGCATASISYSNLAPGGQSVSAETSKFNFLGLTPTPMGELAALRDSLNDQCGDRGVTGIVARSSTIYAVIGVIEKTELRGYCATP